MRIYFGHSTKYDFDTHIYKPLRTSEIYKIHECILPHEGKIVHSKELIKKCDLIIADVTEPSTGLGIEVGWADMLNIPIVFLYREGAYVSHALSFISKHMFSYNSGETFIQAVEKAVELYG